MILRWRCKTSTISFSDVNCLLLNKGLHRMDDMLHPACHVWDDFRPSLTVAWLSIHERFVENQHFNGHPDLIVQGRYPLKFGFALGNMQW